MRWFITRHPGAKAWALNQSLNIDRFESHLVIDDIKPCDIVIGTLPIHLAEQVCCVGARYIHLSLTLPEHLRGRELTAHQMNQCDAKLTEYSITKVAPKER